MMRVRLLVVMLVSAFAVTLTTPQARAQAAVDLKLVLLADASTSIDQTELMFRRQGYASALVHRQVLKAIASGAHARIAIAYVEWGSDAFQDVVVAWTVIDGEASARAFGERLMTQPRKAYGSNAIGSAIAKAQSLIDSAGVRSDRNVIDLSADSANSWGGIPIAVARADALAKGTVINGLAVLCREAGCTGRPLTYDLEAAFARDIIGGPGSFVVTADSATSFEEAVRKKLILEISAAPGTDTRFAFRSQP